jgi:apolipoprotein N-acyltransferase
VTLLPPPGERLLPSLSGALLFLSFPPFHLLLPPFVALVPLLIHVAERPAGMRARWAATRGGLLAGVVYFGLLLHWMPIALIYHTSLAIPAYLAAVAVLSGLTGTFAALLHLVHGRLRQVPLALPAAALWTSMEWVQANLGEFSFPWLGLGMSLTGFPRLAGVAELVGARGLGFLIVAVNGLVATALLRWRAGSVSLRALGPPLAGALGIVAGAGWYGVERAATLELVPAGRIAVVQPNVAQEVKRDRARALDSSLVALSSLTGRIRAGSAGLVVWPEVALPALIGHGFETALRDTLRRMSVRLEAPLLVGAYGFAGGSDGMTFYNTAFLVEAEGIATEVYHKERLVPFVERVPFLDSRLLRRFTGGLGLYGGLGRGQRGAAVDAAGMRFGVLICYESIFAESARGYRRDGADFLVNMTNDAWFGREPWYARTTALWQHPAHLVMRAIENRMGVARSANTGRSLFVDPIGRSYERTALFEPDVRTATVYTTATTTLYVRWGDWLARLAVALSAALVSIAAVMVGARGGEAGRRGSAGRCRVGARLDRPSSIR